MPGAHTSYEHIVIDEKGNPVIAGTTMKVIELVVEKLAHGWSAEELYFQHPYLTLGQIYSAFAYYFDHQNELEAEIEKRLCSINELKKYFKTPAFLKRLKIEKIRFYS